LQQQATPAHLEGAPWTFGLRIKGTLGARRYDLDWVRICASGCLIFYHVGMYYVTWDWHVKSPHAATTVEPLMWLTSPWRLSLLFLIPASPRRTSWTVAAKTAAKDFSASARSAC